MISGRSPYWVRRQGVPWMYRRKKPGSYLLEKIYPQLPDGFEFDIVSGTSVGAIHAGYIAASAHLSPAERAAGLHDTWSGMALEDILRLSPGDWLGIPLRTLGVSSLLRGKGEGGE